MKIRQKYKRILLSSFLQKLSVLRFS